MLDVSVIILTRDEHIHIGRCLEKLMPLGAAHVFVVDSESSDDTTEIAKEHGAEVFVHAWPGTQALQFNWALDNLPIDTEWVLRIDADEYLTTESIRWLSANLDAVDRKVAAIEFVLERKFMGCTISHGTNTIPIVRMFRRGKGRYPEMLMDERIAVDGKVTRSPVVFFDDNLNSFEWWKQKHLGYAQREAKQALAGSSCDARKGGYYKMPPYFRAVLYFIYRFVVRGGFLDGRAGWRWHFWQGLWYRWTVDGEIIRLRHRPVNDLGGAVDLSQYRNRHGLRNMAVRFVWSIVWFFAARWTPRFVLNRWRAILLRMFGAKIGKSCRLTSSMEVWMPSRLRMGTNVWIDRNVTLYDVERITIGDNAIISDGAYICTASHDITKRDFPLTAAPVTIGAGAWVAAHARILPGITIGEGAVVAAGAVVVGDVKPWTVVGGNPARFIKARTIEN